MYVSTTYLAMVVAIVIGVSLLLGIGALSLVSGALNFLFVKPRLQIIKSKHGKTGFAFICKWDQDAEPVTFDRVRVKLLNPFGSPSQVDIIKDFEGSNIDFVRDVNLGDSFNSILTATGLDKASIEVEILATKDGLSHSQMYKANDFIKKLGESSTTIDYIDSKYEAKKEKALYTIPDRTFIAEPLPKAEKHIVIPTNPVFASVLAGAGSAGAAAGAAVENFSVSKVWIEPGCIVCDACAGIIPEVFEVTDSTCIIRPDAPLSEGLRIQEAAEACPVEVIKYTKAS